LSASWLPARLLLAVLKSFARTLKRINMHALRANDENLTVSSNYHCKKVKKFRYLSRKREVRCACADENLFFSLFFVRLPFKVLLIANFASHFYILCKMAALSAIEY